MLIMESKLDNSKSESMNVNGEVRKFKWRIQNFSSIKDERLYSEIFIVDGIKWRVLIFPKGNNVDHLSIYLVVANSATLPSGWRRYAQFGLAVIDQFDRGNSITQVTKHELKAEKVGWGFPKFLALTELHNPIRGYLVDDSCLVEAYISTDRTRSLISHELIVETDSDKHNIKEADRVKAVIDQPKTTKIEPVEITTPSPTHPPCQIVAIEHEDPTEEDMNTFFTTLETELLSSNIVYSQDEAREAVAKLDEALNMTPDKFYDLVKFSPFKQAFKILASFDCSSTTLTVEQKNELLVMEDRLKELADRAAKAMQDKSCLTVKESTKMTITRNLDRNLMRHKEVESNVKLAEQNLAALLAERKGIFRSSKKMKMELEVLEKECEEYESKAKVAEEEEKIVEAEWGKIKYFISSIKGKF